jgi:RNA polymerase sigma factor (sigma-70 family)
VVGAGVRPGGIKMEETLHGREAAFERLIAEYGPRIRAGVRSLISNHEDAEDVIAEINLALWISIPNFSGRSSLRTYIYSVTHHKINDYLRRKYRDADIFRGSLEGISENVKEDSPESRIKISLLSRAEVAILKLIARGFSNEEIAQTIFNSINTIRTHIKHINAKLGTKNRVEAAFVFNRCTEKLKEGDDHGSEKNLL